MRACVRAVLAGLAFRGGFLDARFGQTLVDRLRHAAEFLDFLDMRPRLRREIGGQALDIV